MAVSAAFRVGGHAVVVSAADGVDAVGGVVGFCTIDDVFAEEECMFGGKAAVGICWDGILRAFVCRRGLREEDEGEGEWDTVEEHVAVKKLPFIYAEFNIRNADQLLCIYIREKPNESLCCWRLCRLSALLDLL